MVKHSRVKIRASVPAEPRERGGNENEGKRKTKTRVRYRRENTLTLTRSDLARIAETDENAQVDITRDGRVKMAIYYDPSRVKSSPEDSTPN